MKLLNKGFQHQNHAAPVTRRQFLGQGMLGASSMIVMPSILSLISRDAFAACQAAGDMSRLTPFICYDLAGGCSIAGSNVIVGKAGGQKDFLGATSYRTLGLPDTMHPSMTGQTNEQFGLMFHSDSGFLRGMLSVTSVTTRANIDGVVFCSASNDDTGNNPHNPTYWISKAGAGGQLVRLVGTTDRESGGNALAPAASIDPAIKPVRIVRPEDAVALVNPSRLASLLSPSDAERILKATSKMSGSQLVKFQNKPLNAQVQELIECGYIQSVDLQTRFDANRVNPALDPVVTSIYTQMNTNSLERKAASVAKLVIDGSAGAGTVENGGYDYHTGERGTGEIKDFEAGKIIGQALELAARKGQDLCVYVYTDGGVASNNVLDESVNGRGKGNWQGDSGQRAAAFMLVYKKDGRAPIRDNRRQIGSYQDNGAVNINSGKIAQSVDNLTKAVVANYLALHGMESKLADVVGTDPFGNELDQYLAFNKLR